MSGTRTTALARRVSFQTFWDQELQCWYYTPRRFLILMNKTDFYFFSVSDLSSTSSICRQSSNRTLWNKKAKVWFFFKNFFNTTNAPQGCVHIRIFNKSVNTQIQSFQIILQPHSCVVFDKILIISAIKSLCFVYCGRVTFHFSFMTCVNHACWLVHMRVASA